MIVTQSETFPHPGGIQSIDSYTPKMVCSPALLSLTDNLDLPDCYAEIQKIKGKWLLVRDKNWPRQNVAVLELAAKLGYL